MVLEDNQTEVTCNFCGTQYRFTDAEVEQVRRRAGGGRAQG